MILLARSACQCEEGGRGNEPSGPKFLSLALLPRAPSTHSLFPSPSLPPTGARTEDGRADNRSSTTARRARAQRYAAQRRPASSPARVVRRQAGALLVRLSARPVGGRLGEGEREWGRRSPRKRGRGKETWGLMVRSLAPFSSDAHCSRHFPRSTHRVDILCSDGCRLQQSMAFLRGR
jgi:hypothetical protein